MTRQIKVIEGKYPEEGFWGDWKKKVLFGQAAVNYLKKLKGWTEKTTNSDIVVTVLKKKG